MKLTGISWDEGGCKTKNLQWGEHGYFLELHNDKMISLQSENVRYRKKIRLLLLKVKTIFTCTLLKCRHGVQAVRKQ